METELGWETEIGWEKGGAGCRFEVSASSHHQNAPKRVATKLNFPDRLTILFQTLFSLVLECKYGCETRRVFRPFFIRMRRDVRHAKIINDAPPPPFSRIIFVLPANPGERDGSKCERRICAEEGHH